jgi:hypothetical protein
MRVKPAILALVACLLLNAAPAQAASDIGVGEFEFTD